MPKSDVLRRAPRDPAWACGAVAVLLRVTVVAQALAQNVTVSHPQLDGLYYLGWADAIAHGDLWGRGEPVGGAPFFLNPLYAYALAPLALVLRAHVVVGVLFAQALLGGATTWLAARTAERLFGRAAAWVAGVGVAFSAALVHLDTHLSVSGLGAFLVAATMWSAVPPPAGAALDQRSLLRRAAVTGAWLGVGALARPITPLALPFMAWLHARRAAPGRRVKTALVVVALFAVPAVPSLVRNRLVGGEWTVYTAASGANVFLGNNADARRYRTMCASGRFRFNPGEMHHDIRRHLAPRLGEDASWGRISATLTSDAIDEMLRQPAAAAGFLVDKARWFASPVEVPSSGNLDVDRELAPLLRAACVPTWLLVAVGLAGLVLHARRRDVLCGPGALVLAHVAVLTLVFPLSHYRSPAVPALAVLAGGAVHHVLVAADGRWMRAGVALALTGVAALVGMLPPQPAPMLHTGLVNLANTYHALAAESGARADHDAAESYARRALDRFRTEYPGEPEIAAPWFVLGDTYFSRDGRPDLAAPCYERGLATAPDEWMPRASLVECLRLLRRFDDALRETALIERTVPGSVVVSKFRAEILTQLGRPDEARPYVVDALERATRPAERPREFAIPPDLRRP